MTTQGRKPLPNAPTVPVSVNQVALAQDNAAADQLIEMKAGYSDDRDLANQLLGQAQMADSLSKFAQTVSISKLAYVKEHKLYKALKGKKIGNGSQFLGDAQGESTEKSGNGSQFLAGTWDEYCTLLGRSRDIVDRDILNLQAFGEEALESMSAMGIGYRELRQYRKLPEDQKLALIEVAKAGDKEGFVELAEEIIAKHAKEKEAASENLEAKDQVLAKANERINALEDQLARKFKPRPGSEAKTSQEQTLLDELHESTLAAQIATRRLFVAADTALNGDAREAMELAARQAVEYLAQQLVDIASEFNIAVDFEARLQPNWASDEMLAAMEARIAEANAAAKSKSKPKDKSSTPALQSVAN